MNASQDEANLYKTRTASRVNLVRVHKLPKTELKLSTIDDLFDEYDLDVIKAVQERGAINTLQERIIYSEKYKKQDVEFIFFANAAILTPAHVLLALAKYPKCQLVLFLTTEDENSFEGKCEFSIINSSLVSQLDQENLRKSRPNKRKRIELDAKELIGKLQQEVGSIKGLAFK